ncbi:HlyD family efflux transporter periplasmic adaptor subunit [Rhodovastum atsumiense]|uniref:HlyD family efflux transporter periplasmic adaptor subunit n=1 Tax=Rhodovastum atsumiense TaxID=504468 RepID=A0A5M6IYJ3_9PROT|nr:HlyD family secretion protein [Rhodovastum atsumiense]KAA5613414.1 HlyD family efflux transporter periplasmic adaptor subunit [Rhodovastum atsumiense]CAH2603139.1 HlyD family efflux transporter periplasmic adaptor subunit [Rhodovastum atsumiense]
MIRLSHVLLPLGAAAGLGLGITAVLQAHQPPRPAPPLTEPAAAPFASYIGGSGQVEPPGRMVAIGAQVGGVALEVPVRPGEQVPAGATLIRLDDRVARATRDQKAADLAITRAQVTEAAVALADYRQQLRNAEAVSDRRAVSAEDLAKRRYAAQLYEAKLATARAQVISAETALAEAEAELQRLTITAPFAATVLQVNIRPGEYVSAAALDTPLIRLGRPGRLHLRVQVDENDAWRFHDGATGRATLRGNRDLSSTLRYVLTEPYVTPKTSLTSDSTERVDTRVLEAVFEIEDETLPVRVGQVLDVFIEAPPLRNAVAQAKP